MIASVLSTEQETCILFPNNYTIPISKTDINGKKCKGTVHVNICAGTCKTSEKGTHVFPDKETEKYACIPLKTKPHKHELTDCDAEALPEARILAFNETTECGCGDINFGFH